MAKLTAREAGNALRKLPMPNGLVDFSSNDYLGFARKRDILEEAVRIMETGAVAFNGATGSRLLSGNTALHEELEFFLADYFEVDAALLFNSGYDANIGFFSALPQRTDVVLYDELCHASIRDGIAMGHAQSYKFRHSHLEHLSRQIDRVQQSKSNCDIYVVTESVFSMDGDTPDLEALVTLCEKKGANLVIDEAHAVGVFGKKGTGLVSQLDLQHRVFATIVTFGKAIGCHGAAVLGSEALKRFLVNYARSFIYTTAMPPHSLATIQGAFKSLSSSRTEQLSLAKNITFFKDQLRALGLESHFIPSNSAVHCCVVTGNERVKACALQLQENGFDVRPIMSPTVPKGKERLRFCLHSFNTEKEIKEVLMVLSNIFLKI